MFVLSCLFNFGGLFKSDASEVLMPGESEVDYLERNRTFEERKVTAYHEAGHVLLSILKPSFTEVDEVTIKYDGKQLGHVTNVVPKEVVSISKERLENAAMEDLAGRAAEEIVFGFMDE